MCKNRKTNSGGVLLKGMLNEVMPNDNIAQLNSFKYKSTLLCRLGVRGVFLQETIKKQNTKQQHVISTEMSFLKFVCHDFLFLVFFSGRVFLLPVFSSLILSSSPSLCLLLCLHSSHSDYLPPTGPECYQRNKSHYDLWSHT